MNKTHIITQLRGTAHWINQKGWCPATGGNFSARLDENKFLITASGRDKGQLQETDFLVATHQGQILGSELKPSAELPVHCFLYAHLNAGAVLHTHSVNATVFSRLIKKTVWPISGYEMQKAISGFHSHNDTLQLANFPNKQNMDELVSAISNYQQQHALPFGFLVQGHGIYAWGDDLFAARRHLEGLEFLIECELKQLQFKP